MYKQLAEYLIEDRLNGVATFKYLCGSTPMTCVDCQLNKLQRWRRRMEYCNTHYKAQRRRLFVMWYASFSPPDQQSHDKESSSWSLAMRAWYSSIPSFSSNVSACLQSTLGLGPWNYMYMYVRWWAYARCSEELTQAARYSYTSQLHWCTHLRIKKKFLILDILH